MAKANANLFSTAATIKVEPKKTKADNKEKIKIEGIGRLRNGRVAPEKSQSDSGNA